MDTISQVITLSNYAYNPHVLPVILVGVLVLILGIAVLIRERWSDVSLTLFLVTSSAALWLLCVGVSYLTPNRTVALFWIKMDHLGVVFIPSAVYVFALSIVRRLRRLQFFAWASYLISTFFFLGVLFTDSFVRNDLYDYPWGTYAKYGPLSVSFIGFFFLMMVVNLRLFYVEWKRAPNLTQKKRLKAFFIAFCCAYFASVDYLPANGISFYPLGFFPIALFVGIAAWAIWRYRLVDITPAFAASNILQTMRGAVFVVDLEGKVSLVNRAGCQMLGYREEELLGKPMGSFFKSYSVMELKPGVSAPNENLHDHVMVWRAKDGRPVHVSISTSVLTDKYNKTVAVVYTAHDISEIKAAEAEITRSRAFLNSIVENLPNMIFVKDAQELRFVRLNKAGEELLGYVREAMIGKNDYDFFSKGQADFFTNKDRQVLDGRKLEDIPEEPIQTRFKGERLLHTKKIPIMDEQGKPQYLLGISEDITERKRTEAAIRASAGRLAKQQSALVELTRGTAFKTQDVTSLFHQLTEMCARTLGVERVSVWAYVNNRTAIRCLDLYELGKNNHVSGLELIAADFPGYFQALEAADLIVANDAVQDPRTCEFAQSYLGPLGISSMLDARIHLQGVVNGVLCHEHVGPLREWKPDEQTFVIAMANLASLVLEQEERKRAEQAIIQKTIELARSNAEREQLQLFTYVASHDLREPLQKIMGFGDLLKSHCGDALNVKGRDYLERMQNATLRMNQLIEDILRFARITTEGEQFEPVSLEDVVNEVLSDLEVPLIESKGKVEAGKLPVINADRAQIHQLFQNLISNALKFHKKEESPSIVIKSRPLNNNSVEITVQDNGIGFDEKYLEKIFKPFERLHGKGDYQGSGVGLAICQKIVLRHRGQITAKSALGKGTLFIVTLPI